MEGCGFEVGRDDGGLHKELVSALGRRRGLLLHGLEQDLHLDLLARLDAARVGTNAVLLGSGGLDLESNRLVVGVGDGQSSLDELGERSCEMAKAARLEKKQRESECQVVQNMRGCSFAGELTRKTQMDVGAKSVCN